MRSIAGAGLGGTPRGRRSTCEQRDNCPTPTHQKYTKIQFPTVWGRSSLDSFLLKNQTSAYTRKCQPAHALHLYDNP